MKIHSLILGAGLLLATTVQAQVCPPPQCGIPCEPLLNLECSNNDAGHFNWTDGTMLTESKGMQVPSIKVRAQVPDILGTVQFDLSTNENVRFNTSNADVCVGASFGGLPNPGTIVVQGRTLKLQKQNSFFCSGGMHGPIVCFSVKGQVGAPFPPVQCTPDRVEHVCAPAILS